jgi:hypothetical protein
LLPVAGWRRQARRPLILAVLLRGGQHAVVPVTEEGLVIIFGASDPIASGDEERDGARVPQVRLERRRSELAALFESVGHAATGDKVLRVMEEADADAVEEDLARAAREEDLARAGGGARGRSRDLRGGSARGR